MAKVSCSQYLVEKIEDMAQLVDSLNQTYEYVSILGCDVKGKTFKVTSHDMKIQDYADNERGFVLRLLNHGRYFEYSFNDFLDFESMEI